jgi:predicted aspartyl protease
MLLAAALLAPHFAAAQQRDSNGRAPSAHRYAPQYARFQSLELERSSQNHLLLRAMINGKRALLVVDSGAPFSAINQKRVAHFRMESADAYPELPEQLRVNGGYNALKVARSLRLGSLDLIEHPMVALDLSAASDAAKADNEQPIDGIIGADILFPTHAVLDCGAQRLILKVDPKALGGPPGIDFSEMGSVPIDVTDGNNLFVKSVVNGVDARLMIDTGAYQTILHRRFVRRMKIPLRKSSYLSAGVNMKKTGVQLATISRLSIGSVRIGEKKVNVTDLGGLFSREALDETPPVAGLLGSEILQDHNGIIDFRTKTLYLRN